MRFLIDVCVGTAVAEFLIRAGHDVAQVRDADCRMDDQEILEQAQQQERILVTLDKDFGVLVFREGLSHAGIIRLPDVRRGRRVSIMGQILERHGKDLEEGAIVTVTRHLMRVRRRSSGR